MIDVEIEGLPFQLWRQPHSSVETIGFRIGGFAYSTDCVDLPAAISTSCATGGTGVDGRRRPP